MTDDKDGLEPVTPDSSVDRESSKGDDEQSMSSDGEASITIKNNACPHCGAVVPLTYHDRCQSPIVRIDGAWQCGSCGVEMSPNSTCTGCGKSLKISPANVPLDLRTSSPPELIEQAVHEETNQQRMTRNLEKLTYSHHLSAIALQHSRDMAQRDYFSHESPEGESPGDRYRTFDHDTQSSGENLAIEHAHLTESAEEAAEAVVAGWMDSPPHRENILRDRFEKEGIGVYLETSGALYVTQNFF